MTATRILVPSDEIDIDTLRIVLSYVQEICEKQSDPVEEIVLLVPVKQSIKHTGLASALGNAISKKLDDGQAVSLLPGVSMRLETVKTLRWLAKRCVVICAYADKKMLDLIDGESKLVGVVAIPYAPDALDQWQKTWSAHVHGLTQQPIAQKLIADPVVEQAFLGLTGTTNISRSVLHPSDKEHAELILRILRIKKHTFNTQDLRAWAVRHQWHPDVADELAALAARISNLKTKPTLKRAEDGERLYQRWVEKASE